MDEKKLRELNLNTVARGKREYQVEGAPDIGLYFTCPKKVSGYEFPIAVGHAFREVNKSPYEKNMHVLEFDLDQLDEDVYNNNAELVSEICKNSGIIFIVKSSIENARKYKADGIILDSAQIDKIEQIRNEFGEEFIIGLDLQTSSEALELALENDDLIDYVAFNYNANDSFKLIEKFKANSQSPCAVKGFVTPEICEQLVHFQTDFIGCGEYIWNKKDKLAESVNEMLATIEKAATSPTVQ